MTKGKTEERVLNSGAKETGKKIQKLMQQGRTVEVGEPMKQTSGKKDN